MEAMPRPTRVATCLLLPSLLLAALPLRAAAQEAGVPVVQATSALPDSTPPENTLADLLPAGLVADIKALLPELGDLPFTADANGVYSAQVGLLKAWAYPMKGSDRGLAVRMSAMPDAISSITSAVGVELTSAVVFWLPDSAAFIQPIMPAELKTFAADELKLPSGLRGTKGMNLFGRLTSTVDVLKTLGLPNNLLVGIAMPQKKTRTTLSLVEWQNPFGLKNSAVRTGTLVMERDTLGRRSIEAWGTADLNGSTGFTLLAAHDGTKLRKLGFDKASVGLDDVRNALGALPTGGLSFKLPGLGVASDAIVLANKRYSPPAAGAQPDSANMMFKTTVGELGDLQSLYINAKGTVFGVGVADMTLRASSSELYVRVPPECPLRPIGMKIDLSASGLPFESWTDAGCYLAALGEVAAVVSKGAQEAAQAVSTNAVALGGAAQQELDRLQVERAAAWASALGTATSVNDAKQAADRMVNRIWNTIDDLNKGIDDLANQIANLWDQVWEAMKNIFSGGVDELKRQIAGKEKQKKEKVDARDFNRVALAAAERTQQEAAAAAGAIMAPNFSPAVDSLSGEILGHSSRVTVQKGVAAFGDSMRSRNARTDSMVAAAALALLRDTTRFTAAGLSVSEVMSRASAERIGSEAMDALVAQRSEQLLAAAVPTLPTMAFDTAVRIVAGGGCVVPDPKTYDGKTGRLMVKQACANTPDEVFKFKANGTVQHVASGQCLATQAALGYSLHPVPLRVDVDLVGNVSLTFFTLDLAPWPEWALPWLGDCARATPFFFDPLDGTTRYQVNADKFEFPSGKASNGQEMPSATVTVLPGQLPLCLSAGKAADDGTRPLRPACYSYRWTNSLAKRQHDPVTSTDPALVARLVPASAGGGDVTRSAAPGGIAAPASATAAQSTVTNLRPLTLPPTKRR